MVKGNEQKKINCILLEAVEKKDLQGAKAALAQGADIEAKDNIGQTALIAASRNGNKEMARLLIEKGADVNAKMRIIEDPRWNWDPELPSPDRKYQAMVYSAIEIAHESDEYESNPMDTNGKTALMEAALHWHKEIVELLIRNGAEVNAETEKRGWTALMSAALEGHLEIVRILLENGADVNARNSAGLNALHFARTHGHEDVASLLEQGKDE